MIYNITYYAGSTPTGSDSCTGSIERAAELATSAVARGLAQRAEVRDLERRILYRVPQIAPL